MNTVKCAFLSAILALPVFAPAVSAQDWSLSGNAAGASDFLGTTNAQDLVFKTNAAERMRILQSNGFIGMGTSSPQQRLHLRRTSPAEPQLRLEDVGGAWDMWSGGNFHVRKVSTGEDWLKLEANASRLSVGTGNEIYLNTSTQQIGFGTASPHSKLTVNGTITPDASCIPTIGTSTYKWDVIYACNGTISTSDAAMKENIREIPYGLDAVMALRPVSFTWKNDPGYGTKLGLIAQEVRDVIGEVVKTGDDGTMGIFYSDLIPVVVKAIQDEEGISSGNAKRHATLASLSDDLDKRLADLESAISGRNLSGADTREFSVNGIMLDQNDPNPTGTMTTISYGIPASVAKADLVISEITTGKEMFRSALKERGNAQIQISVQEIPSGTYIYSIVADGKVSASRKMVVAK